MHERSFVMEFDHKKDQFKNVGYAFVPIQTLDKVYSPRIALKAGTIFPELNITIDEYERGLYNGK